MSCVLSDNATLYRERCMKLADRITKDLGHPLNKEFTLLPSGRRYRVPYTRTSRHKSTFVPTATLMLNGL